MDSSPLATTMDYNTYPHIVDMVLLRVDRWSLAKLRRTNRFFCNLVEPYLAEHILVNRTPLHELKLHVQVRDMPSFNLWEEIVPVEERKKLFLESFRQFLAPRPPPVVPPVLHPNLLRHARVADVRMDHYPGFDRGQPELSGLLPNLEAVRYFTSMDPWSLDGPVAVLPARRVIRFVVPVTTACSHQSPLHRTKTHHIDVDTLVINVPFLFTDPHPPIIGAIEGINPKHLVLIWTPIHFRPGGCSCAVDTNLPAPGILGRTLALNAPRFRAGITVTFVGLDQVNPLWLGGHAPDMAQFEHDLLTNGDLDDKRPEVMRFLTREEYRAEVGEEVFRWDTVR